MMKYLKRTVLFTVSLALLAWSVGHAQTSFGKYGPVAGVQMNTGATPFNFAAGITDIQTLLSASPGVVLGGATGGAKGVGSINATALFINGAAVGTSTGAVSSVALGAPGTCFGVTGSPVTSAGTLAYTLSGTTAQFIRGDGSCSNTLTGPLSITAGTTPQVALLDSTAANGAYFTFSRSGTALADIGNAAQVFSGGTLDNLGIGTRGAQAINLGTNGIVRVGLPSTGGMIVNIPTSGIAFSSFGIANGFAGQFTGSSTTGQSRGLQVNAGTNSSDFAFQVNNQANSVTYLQVSGNGAISMGPAANSLLVSGTTGGVTVNTPSSGNALTLGAGEFITAGAGLAAQIDLGGNANGFQTASFTVGQSSSGIAQLVQRANLDMQFWTNTVDRMVLSAAGALTVNAPSSGTTLTLNGITGNQVLTATDGTHNFGLFLTSTAGQEIQFGATSNHGIALVTNNANRVVLSAAGNVVVGAPASGVAFTATGTTSQYAGLFTGGGAAGTQKGLSAVTTTQNAADKILNVNNSISNLLDIFGDGHGDLGPNLSWTAAGNVAIAAPTSGVPLSVSGAGTTTSGAVIAINGAIEAGQALSAQVVLNSGGPNFGLLENDSSGVWSLAYGTLANALGTPVLKWNSTGNVTIATPSSGTTLAVTGTTGITAIAANGNVVHGEQCAYKTSTTARSSNTTPTADPDLTVTLAVGGTYVLDMWIEINATSGGTQGIQFAFDGTAATGGLQGGRGTSGYINGAVFALPEASINNTIQNIATISTTVNDWLHVSGTWTGFSAGTFFLKWAQNTSNVSSTNVLAGAYMCVKQIG